MTNSETNCPCCIKGMAFTLPRVCPECNHIFRGNGWDGIDAHWRTNHDANTRYEDFWVSLCRKHGGPVKLTLETRDVPVAFRLKNDLPPGVSVKLLPVIAHRGIDSDTIAIALLALANNVSINLFSSWLYDKLKGGRSKTVIINKREIEIEEGNIKRIIEESVRIE